MMGQASRVRVCVLCLGCALLLPGTLHGESAQETARREDQLAETPSKRLESLVEWILHSSEADQASQTFESGQEAIGLIENETEPLPIDPLSAFIVYRHGGEAAWHLGKLDLAGEWIENAVRFARELHDAEKEFEALQVRTAIDRRLGRLTEALTHAHRLSVLATRPEQEAQALSAMAMVYRAEGDLPRALETYLEALEIGRGAPFGEHLGTLLANIGRVYAQLEQFEEAIRYTHHAVEAMQAEGSKRGGAHVLYNLAAYYARLERFEEALVHYETALQTLRDIGDEGEASLFILSGMAVAYSALGREDEALREVETSIRLAESQEVPAWKMKVWISAGKTYQRLGRLPEARDRFERALTQAEDLNDHFNQILSLESLSKIEERLGNLQQALDHQRQAYALRVRDQTEKSQQEVSEWKAKLDTAMTEHQLVQSQHIQDVQEIALQRQTILRNASLVIALLLGLSGLGAFLSYRKQRQSHLALTQAHHEVRQQKSDLELALSQVKLLSGLLPICGSCKSIRGDDGYWQRVEEYLTEHSEATFSHGLCPPCFEKQFPGAVRREVVR